MKVETKRKHYIDNLRWACILLLIPFHTAMAWNCWGDGNYIWFYKSRILSSFIIFISPWYMALLFVLAGISTRLAFLKRTYGGFIRERLLKLLLPFITGMLTVVPLMSYYADRFHNDYHGSFFSHYAIFFTKFTDLTGNDGGFTPGHLWFLLYLFIISMICLGLIALQKKYLPKLSFEKMNAKWLMLVVAILPFANQIFNISGKSIGLYMILYLIGYYIIAEDKIFEQIVKYRYIYLIVMLIADVIDVYLFIWVNNANEIINSVAMYITCWFGILTLLGFGKTNFDQNNYVTQYFTKRSFLIYIFHFIWIIIFMFYISRITNNAIILVIASISGSFIMTLITCEIIRHIPLINCLFGVKKQVIK